MEDAMTKLARAAGVSVIFGGCRYNKRLARFDFDMVPAIRQDDDMTQAARDFALFCSDFGMKPSDFGRDFTLRDFEGKVYPYQIAGYDPSDRKAPVIARRLSDGKLYRFSGDHAAKMLGRTTPTAPHVVQ